MNGRIHLNWSNFSAQKKMKWVEIKFENVNQKPKRRKYRMRLNSIKLQ